MYCSATIQKLQKTKTVDECFNEAEELRVEIKITTRKKQIFDNEETLFLQSVYDSNVLKYISYPLCIQEEIEENQKYREK